MDLYHLDNLKMLESLSPESINFIYCDVLFGTGKNFKDYKDIKRDEIEGFYEERFIKMRSALIGSGVIAIHCDEKNSHLFRFLLDKVFGYQNFVNTIIWEYGVGGGPGTKYLRRCHQTILVYSKGAQYTFNKQLNQYGSSISDVWRIKSIADKSGYLNDGTEILQYASQKPIELLERLVSIFTNPEDTVADFFCGSGTTVIAAEKLKRKWIGCDINPKAIEIARERVINARGMLHLSIAQDEQSQDVQDTLNNKET